ncbi:MAG: hypothetical protein NZ531_03270, partial [Aquificaceae bacterium]|nr:hypothetical protein [Aquificaceae bacterium]
SEKATKQKAAIVIEAQISFLIVFHLSQKQSSISLTLLSLSKNDSTFFFVSIPKRWSVLGFLLPF